MNHISKKKINRNISRISSKATKTELLVRSVLYRIAYRFRLNGKVSKRTDEKGMLLGKPDIVLAKFKIVIFVYGCFGTIRKIVSALLYLKQMKKIGR